MRFKPDLVRKSGPKRRSIWFFDQDNFRANLDWLYFVCYYVDLRDGFNIHEGASQTLRLVKSQVTQWDEIQTRFGAKVRTKATLKCVFREAKIGYISQKSSEFNAKKRLSTTGVRLCNSATTGVRLFLHFLNRIQCWVSQQPTVTERHSAQTRGEKGHRAQEVQWRDIVRVRHSASEA